MPKMSNINSMLEYVMGVMGDEYRWPKTDHRPDFDKHSRQDQCSVSESPHVYVIHRHSHSEQTRLRPSPGILCSIYFLGSRDAAYINTEQRLKELGIWEEISLYHVNSKGEQVTSLNGHHSHFLVVRLSQSCFYLERGGMWYCTVTLAGHMAQAHMSQSVASPGYWPVTHSDTALRCQWGHSGVSTDHHW